MKKFNWNEFKNKDNKIVVHCKTEEEAIDFCKQMYKHGMEWASGDSYLNYTHYGVYRDKTCYGGDGGYQSYDYFEKYKYKILEWSDYMHKEFTKADLEDGMVVEYRGKSYGKRLVIGDMLIAEEEGSHRLIYYNEDLIDTTGDKDFDIMRIYKIQQYHDLTKICDTQTLNLSGSAKNERK